MLFGRSMFWLADTEQCKHSYAYKLGTILRLVGATCGMNHSNLLHGMQHATAGPHSHDCCETQSACIARKCCSR
jgi:hypothetical protein